ncbi:MAG: ATP-dependent RNA helicase HrpA [Propionibacteriaceae bacterium]|jgi:ATP-dependent helicase HrpA|nr:ATP-dependent RNA helicase HrpA [Propionibacteriaceae bacterium]
MSTAQSLNLEIDPGLPIAAHEAEIAGLIMTHQVVIVAGETGSGKTTQLPKICLKLGREHIGHTQPRRIAAHSVAQRLADETGSELGDVIGYQVRFTATTSAQTQVKLMTDGIMLAEIGHDRLLRRYDTIIIDEAHERSLNIDFLLGYLKQLLPKRPDLKVVITSATIDTARFSAHFDNAPIVEVSGRTYPVEVRYAPVGEDVDLAQSIVAAINSLPRSGDILVFCSGERDIKDADKAISGARLPGVEVLPLFARLTMAEQARVFAPHRGQRVVLATNVAETSLTVPGIRYVVDPGLARVSRYSARTKVQRLPIEAISQASANQRAGRCGRVAPGICVRLYTEEDFLSRPLYTEPEILRTNLASVILSMANARLGDIADFPFVEAPDRSHIADGLRLLTELGAIAGDHHQPRLTGVGRKLAMLPIDPKLGRMLLEAAKLDCLPQTLIIVAGLSIQDVRERPQDHREAADASHARFGADTVVGTVIDETGRGGDFAALLRLWTYLKQRRKELSSSQFRRMCRDEYLNYLRTREWQDVAAQLRQMCRQLKLGGRSDGSFAAGGLGARADGAASSAPMETVMTACLSGLLSNIGALDPGSGGKDAKGRRRGPREYVGARGARFAISPGSLMAKTTPELVMAVELVETSRLWAHTVGEISAEQVEKVGRHMLKRSYSEPFFSTSTGTVLAHEKVTLLGVPRIADRRVGYGRIDPEAARAIFVQSGLVEGLLTPHQGSPYAQVAARNAGLRAQIEEMEDKTRRRGAVVDDADLADFFDSRIPPELVSAAQLDRWLRADARHVDALTLTMDDLLDTDAVVDKKDYPDTWTFGPTRFGLDYRFAPGESHDGVTVKVPLAQLSALDPAPFTWGVPGARQELAAELIRTLPKSVRTNFVPAPDWARRTLDWLDTHDGDQTKPFTAELSRALRGLSGQAVEGWDVNALPDHLRMGFLVGQGPKARYSRDLETLQADLGHQVRLKLASSSPRRRAEGTTWVFGSIPPTVTVKDHGITAVGYPALEDHGSQVGETLATSLDQAQASHRRGLARLICLALPEPYKWIVSHLSNPDKMALSTSPYPTVPDLLADARFAAVLNLSGRHDPWSVRDPSHFDQIVTALRPDQVDATHHIVAVAASALRQLITVRAQMGRLDPTTDLAKDVSSQVDNLVFPGFLHVIDPQWLDRLPVWLKAVEIRLTSAQTDPGRDETRMEFLDPVVDAYDDLLDAQARPTPASERIGYLIEELRLQAFAQTLGTRETVSPKRVLKAIAQARLQS